MEENLEKFVNLLNQYRQHRPVPKELSRLPNWAQRELSKRPEATPRQDAPQLNGTPLEDKPKPEIVVSANQADTPPQPVAPPPEASPQARGGASWDQPKSETPVEKLGTPVSALDPIDPKRDPEAWLARFLSDEGDELVLGRAPSTITSTTQKKDADKVGPISTGPDGAEQSEAGTQVPEQKISGENRIETPPNVEPAKPSLRSSEATELVPLKPVIVTRMGSVRRVPVAYALPVAATMAVIIALGVGGYWLVHSKARLVADIKTMRLLTAMPAAKSPPVAVTAPSPQQPKAQLTETKPASAAAQPVGAVKAAAVPHSQTKMAEALPTVSKSPSVAPLVLKTQTKPVQPQTKIAGTQSTAAVMPPSTPPVAAPQAGPVTSHPIAAPAPASPAVPLPRTASATPTQDPSALAMLLTTPAPTTNKPAAMATQSEAEGTVAPGEEPTWQRNAVPAPPFQGQPQIAIVIDDLGLDRNRTERAIALKGPITLSFLAYASDLPEQTEAARRAGHELVVHVPMEPILRPKLVTQTSGSAESPHAELLRRLRWDLSRFSGYVGVDNHLGNRLSSDPESTEAVIDELKARGLMFLDSRTGGASALSDAARKGVPTVTRDVLLDDDVTVSSVNDRLSQLEAIARQRGTAVAVGHPHDLTLDALKAWIASLPGKGLQLVPLTAIVRDREQHEVRAD
jgi:uncharacterized protein